MNALELDTVLLSPDRTCLEILDQTLLPGEVKTLHLSDMRDIWEAIYSLRVRGAPAIGVCAGYALALAASQIETEDKDVFFARLRETKEYLASARPTAVNLFWALDRRAGLCSSAPRGRHSHALQRRNARHREIRHGDRADVYRA